MSLPPKIRSLVQGQAQGCCEYCLVHEEDFTLAFQVDHIIPIYHNGSDELDNLAWSCPICNNRKGTNLSGIDPQTGEIQRLFHPRKDHRKQCFILENEKINGVNTTGRTTVSLLQLNRPDALIARSIRLKTKGTLFLLS